MQLPNDLEIPLLGIHPREMKACAHKKSCTHVFIVVVFKIAKK